MKSDKKVVILLSAGIGVLIGVVVVWILLRKDVSYEDYIDPGALPSVIGIEDKDNVTSGFYSAGSVEEAKNHDSMVSTADSEFKEFLRKFNKADISYSGSEYPENRDDYSSSVAMLFFGTTGDLIALIGCIDNISETYGVDKSAITIDGDSVSESGSLYYPIIVLDEQWRVYFTTYDGVSYGYAVKQ